MIPRIFLLLVAGAIPLSAQNTMQDGGHMYQPPPQATQTNDAPEAAALRPGVNAPPPGVLPPPPQRAAAPFVSLRLSEFTISPTTYRQGMVYKDDIKTTIRLNIPAPRPMVIHIVSSDPTKVRCTNIVLIRFAQEGTGGINIIWNTITRDSQFEFKAYTEDDPDFVLHGRIYVKKNIEQTP